MKIQTQQQESEFIYIENAFVKIGTLLAIGYGEAGACIIANNMVDNAFT